MFPNGIFLILLFFCLFVWREWENKVVFTLRAGCVMSVPSQLWFFFLFFCFADTPGLSNKGICSRCKRRMFKWRSSGEISLLWLVRVLQHELSLVDAFSLKPGLNPTCFLWYQAVSCRIGACLRAFGNEATAKGRYRAFQHYCWKKKKKEKH